MQEFDYNRPATSGTAVDDAGSDGLFMAGGTEVLNWLRLGISNPVKIVDVTHIESLQGVMLNDNVLEIGASVTLSELSKHPDVLKKAPALAEACAKVASPQIRNRATLAGNLLQKTRCLYFRAEAAGHQKMPWACNKRVADSGCPALDGSDEYSALFGGNEACVASHPSDTAVALAALDAEVLVTGPNGERVIPITDFHLTPKDAADRGLDPATAETRLDSNELITAVRVPLSTAAQNSTFFKVHQRNAYEYALLSVAVAIEKSADTVKEVAISIGGVALKPIRLPVAEEALRDQVLTSDIVTKAIDQELKSAEPMPGQEYKIKLAANAVVRALVGERS